MNIVQEGELDSARLQSLLVKSTPSAVFLPPRIIRRILMQREEGVASFKVIKDIGHIAGKSEVLAHVAEDELGRRAEELPERLILVGAPEETELAGKSRPQVLLHYWSMLFQGRLQLALEEQLSKENDPATLQKRIEHVGRTEFAEIRQVLAREGYPAAHQGEREIYIQFVAIYFTLLHFSPQRLPIFFPILNGRIDLESQLREDIDIDGIFQETRPEAMPASELDTVPEGTAPMPVSRPRAIAPMSDREYQKKSRLAHSAEERGNDVRAAILHTQLAEGCRADQSETHRQLADDALRQLAQRLQIALACENTSEQDWYRALLPLLKPATEGFWPPAARLLYDLQKVCVDRERDLTRIDVAGWLLSLGKKPLQSPIPALKEVFLVQHLRKASHRLLSITLDSEDWEALQLLLADAIEREEDKLRNDFRPLVETAMEQVGFKPANFAEQMARDKLREELLDRVVDHGMLNMSEVRDAIARNQIKLNDLSSAGEFVRGDQLLRLNEELPELLPGVYHRGEFYLRWLQSTNSVLFGTRPGRFLTRYVLVPFGTAYVALKGIDAIWKEAVHLLHIEHGEPPKMLASWWSIGFLGVLLLLLIHWRDFRQGAFLLLKHFAQGIKIISYDAALWLGRQPLVQAVLRSPLVQFIRRHLLEPLLLTALVMVSLLLFQVSNRTLLFATGVVFVVAAVFLNSRFGRTTNEILSERLIQSWHRLSLEFFPALFHFVMDTFKWLTSEIERLLYSVDQWLRFQRQDSDSKATLVGKGFVAFIWSGFVYMVRFCIILVIEPTFNPIKHFPVVTVAAKLMLPVYAIADVTFAARFPDQWRYFVSGLLFVGIVLAMPGVFGFLVWELKESWRLYQANRPLTLRPVIIGSHGETLAQFLKPGLHSGTIPKIFTKWRRGLRREDDGAVQKCDEKLHHVEQSLHGFVEREFLHPIVASRLGEEISLSVAEIELANRRIRIGVECLQYPEDVLIMDFDLRARWLLMRLGQAGWLDRIERDQKKVVAAALAGLCKRAGVQLVDEQICACLSSLQPDYDIVDRNLIVWPGKTYRVEVIYNLRERPMLYPLVKGNAAAGDYPALKPGELLFSENDISWEHWVEIWEKHQLGKKMSLPLAEQLFIYRKS